MATAISSANDVQTGALQPKPAFAFRHHNQVVQRRRGDDPPGDPATNGRRIERSKAHEERENRYREKKHDGEIQTDDGGIADAVMSPGNRAPTPMAAAGPSSIPPSSPTRKAVGAANPVGPRRCAPAPARAIDAGVQVTERSQLLAQFVHALVVHNASRPTNADSSRRRSPWCRMARGRVCRFAQLRGKLPRTLHTAERYERGLARVGADGFSGLGRIARDVEEVVDDLERQSEVLRVGR